MPVATKFVFCGEDGSSLGDVADLDTMLTGVDAETILRGLGTRDRSSDRDPGAVKGIVRHRNPGALLHRTPFSDVSLVAVLGTGPYDVETASLSAGWVRELDGFRTPEIEKHGIESFVCRRRVPLRPERLVALVSRGLPDVGAAEEQSWHSDRWDEPADPLPA